MSTTVSRTSATTTLRIGSVKTPVALYKIVADPSKSRKWELANADGEPWVPPAAPSAPDQPADPLGAVTSEKVAAEEITIEQVAEGAIGSIGGAVPPAVPPSVDPRWKSERPGISDALAAHKSGSEPEAVEPEKPRKGIRKADGGFVDLTDQIEEVSELASLEEMRVLHFIDMRHLPRERIIGSYYLAGGEMTAEMADAGLNTWPPGRLLRVLLTALRASQKVAIIRFTKRKGQTLGALVARRDGALLLLELAFAAQIRRPNGKCLAHTKAQVSQGAIEGAVQLIDAMAAKRDSLDGIRNGQVVMEDELITRAEAGEMDDYELVADPEVAAETDQLGELLAAAAKAPA